MQYTYSHHLYQIHKYMLLLSFPSSVLSNTGVPILYISHLWRQFLSKPFTYGQRKHPNSEHFWGSLYWYVWQFFPLLLVLSTSLIVGTNNFSDFWKVPFNGIPVYPVKSVSILATDTSVMSLIRVLSVACFPTQQGLLKWVPFTWEYVCTTSNSVLRFYISSHFIITSLFSTLVDFMSKHVVSGVHRG